MERGRRRKPNEVGGWPRIKQLLKGQFTEERILLVTVPIVAILGVMLVPGLMDIWQSWYLVYSIGSTAVVAVVWFLVVKRKK